MSLSHNYILFDIGNTSITYGVYSGARLDQFGSVLIDDIPKIDKKLAKKGLYEIDTTIGISSVVPQNSKILKQLFLKKRKLKVLEAGRNLPIKIKHKYINYSKLGIDRKVNVFGALRIYRAPLLIIDFGTAITFDYVDKLGVFRGGMILPGPQISFQALLTNAALLPKSLRLPNRAKAFLGHSTYDCMSSGILQGYGALTDGLIERFQKKFSKKLKVIATGGFTENLKPYTKRIQTVDAQLPIKSLMLLIKEHTAR